MATQLATTVGGRAWQGLAGCALRHDDSTRGPRHLLPIVDDRGRDNDAGMTTAEYAIGTLAAAAFAAVLYAVVSSDSVVGALTGLVERALSVSY